MGEFLDPCHDHAPNETRYAVDPGERFLFSTGQQSGRLTSYHIDQETGALTPLETYEVGNNPMWVLMTTLDG